jgi:ElaB/YqjD/DUF883 family membrane-anchored ribosome-binding protein
MPRPHRGATRRGGAGTGRKPADTTPAGGRAISDIAKTKAGAKVAPDIERIADDVAALRSDFGRLIGSLKREYSSAGRHGVDMAEDTVRRVGNEVSDTYHALAEHGGRSAKMARQYIGGKPLVTVLIGAAIGLVAGRLLSR